MQFSMLDVFPAAAQPIDIVNSATTAPTIDIYVCSPKSSPEIFYADSKSKNKSDSNESHLSFSGSSGGLRDSPVIFKVSSPGGGSLVNQVLLPQEGGTTYCATIFPFACSLRSSASNTNASVDAPQHIVRLQSASPEEQSPDDADELLVQPKAVHAYRSPDIDLTDDAEFHGSSPEPELCFTRTVHVRTAKATILTSADFDGSTDGDSEYETFHSGDSDGVEVANPLVLARSIKRSRNPCFLEMDTDDGEHLYD